MSELITIYDKHQDVQQRAQMQQRLIAKHQLPLITLTTYLPQSLIHNTIGKKVFALASKVALAEIKILGGTIVKEAVFQRKSTHEAMYVVSGISAMEIKKNMIKLETRHLLGSFFNFDVMNGEGKTISRKSCELDARKCIICDQAASYCSCYYKHTQEELEQKTHTILASYFETQSETV